MLIAVWETALVLAVGLAAAESGLLCPRGAAWWSAQKSSCINCTLCEAPLLVLRPCAPHQDTVCANLGDLQLDWDFLRKPKPSQAPVRSRRKHQSKEPKGSGDGALALDEEGSGSSGHDIIIDDDEDYERRGDDVTGLHAMSDYDYESARDDRHYVVSVNSDDEEERIVLALIIAISMLFTILACVFSVYYYRQWRMLKKRLEDDVEGSSTTISLMMASAEAHESLATSGPENLYSNLRCAYLEQLLVGKGKDRPPGPGNVYIQENNY